MYFSTLIAASAIVAAAAAQFTGLPQCAQTPLITAIGSSTCQITDTACICADKALQTSLAAAILSQCSADDQQKALSFASTLCPSVAGAASSSAAPAAAASSTPADEVQATPQASSVPVSQPAASTPAYTPTTFTGAPPSTTMATTGSASTAGTTTGTLTSYTTVPKNSSTGGLLVDPNAKPTGTNFSTTATPKNATNVTSAAPFTGRAADRVAGGATAWALMVGLFIAAGVFGGL